jgi:MFS family permease
MVYSLALLPTAMSATTTPRPLTTVSLNLPNLWRNSPIAVFGVLMVGVSNASFGTLAAVYGARIGLSLSDIALFASIPILAGAAVQVPVGIASDRHDRRRILVGVAALALVADTLFLLGGFTAPLVVMALAALFGATVFSMYPIMVAHANDHAAPGTAIQVSGGLLLAYGVGSIVGPGVAGVAMSEYGPRTLFAVTATAHILLIAFALVRLRYRPPVAPENKVNFQAAPLPRAATPETAALAASEAERAAEQERSTGGEDTRNPATE